MSGITILDGGMGQELLARTGAKPTGLWATQVMIDHPEAVSAVHDSFFAAGAEIATTNTYAIHRDRLEDVGLGDQFAALHTQALDMALAARDSHGAGLVAASLGPLGWSYRPDFAPPPEQAAELYAEIVALHAGADLLLIETMSGVDQAKGALMGCAEAKIPVWLGLSVDDDDGTKLRSGEPLAEALPLLDQYNAAAVLVNCSRPEAVTQALPTLATQPRPFGAYANGFTGIASTFKKAMASADLLSARQDLDPTTYAEHASEWVDLGATIIGGCCEIGPAHIAELSRRFGGAR